MTAVAVPVWAVLPLKSWDHAKSRLAPELSASARRQLVEAMARDVLAALLKVRKLAGVLLLASREIHEQLCAPGPGEDFCWLEDRGEQGLNAALAVAAAWLAAKFQGGGGPAEAGDEAAGRGTLSQKDGMMLQRERMLSQKDGMMPHRGGMLVVPGDLPLLRAEDIEYLLEVWAGPEEVLLVPDRHGVGTNLLLSTLRQALPFAFGPASAARHSRLAARQGLILRRLHLQSAVLDIDTAADLRMLHQCPLQAGATLEWLRREGREERLTASGHQG